MCRYLSALHTYELSIMSKNHLLRRIRTIAVAAVFFWPAMCAAANLQQFYSFIVLVHVILLKYRGENFHSERILVCLFGDAFHHQNSITGGPGRTRDGSSNFCAITKDRDMFHRTGINLELDSFVSWIFLLLLKQNDTCANVC